MARVGLVMRYIMMLLLAFSIIAPARSIEQPKSPNERPGYPRVSLEGLEDLRLGAPLPARSSFPGLTFKFYQEPDYDEAGRLRFTASDPAAQAGELAGAIGDAKGGSAALRMSYARMRRYGSLHIGARTAQLDGVLARLAAYRGELGAQRAALEAWAEQALWADPAFIAAARAGLEAVDGALAGLEARARGARAGFEALPRLEQAGVAPAAVEHDALPE